MTLIGYWPLNEESGDTAHDHSGNENHGSLNGGVTQGPEGILGSSAYSFDGNDSTVSTSGFSKGSEVTVSFWIKFSSFPTGQFENLVGDGEASNDYCWMIYRTEDAEKLRPHVRTGDGTSSFDSATTVQTGEWYHIVETTSNGQLRLFINAREDENSPLSYSGTPVNTSNKIYIGQDGREYAPDAEISEVRIYDRPLTKSEVQYLYNVGKRGQHVTSKKTS